MSTPGPQPASPAAATSATGGDASLDVVLARLDGIDEVALHERPDIYQAVHAELQNALAAIDDA